MPAAIRQATKRNRRRGGRPLKPVDPLRVTKLASEGLSEAEIAATLDCSVEVIKTRFSYECERGRLLLTGALRRKQTARALAGSDRMLIWLGRNLLGQTDKVDVDAKLRAQAIVHDERLDKLTLDEQKTIYEILNRARKRTTEGKSLPAPAETSQSSSVTLSGPDRAGTRVESVEPPPGPAAHSVADPPRRTTERKECAPHPNPEPKAEPETIPCPRCGGAGRWMEGANWRACDRCTGSGTSCALWTM